MKRLWLVLALALVPSSLARADGCPATTCGTSSSALPGSRILVLRPNGQQGTLVGYDVVSGQKRFTLGPGMLSANGTVYFTAKRAGTSTTTLARLNARTGARQLRWAVRGKWFLTAVESSGRLLVLQRGNQTSTTFAIADGRRARSEPLRTVTLRGSYQVEALSPDARRLFLVHWLRNGYELRRYDFAARRLDATRLAEPNEKMIGTAWSAIATRDGRWLLTLYLKPNNLAFVHALDLRSGIAHCIDLPRAGSDFQSLGSFALVLSPDERTLYLANPLLGLFHAIDLVRPRVVRTVEFRPQTGGVAFGIGPNAAVSRDGRLVSFAFGRFVWSYDAAKGRVRGPYAIASPNQGIQVSAAGLGFTPDGRRVVAIRSDERVVRLDAATGRRLD